MDRAASSKRAAVARGANRPDERGRGGTSDGQADSPTQKTAMEQKPAKARLGLNGALKQIEGTRSGAHRCLFEIRTASMGVRSMVRGEHLDSARMLSQCHGLTMRQPYRRAEGLERLIVDAEKSSARAAWQSRRATPITRGSERRSLRMARAREAGRREEKGLERLHRLFSTPKESGVARGGENSLSPGWGPP